MKLRSGELSSASRPYGKSPSLCIEKGSGAAEFMNLSRMGYVSARHRHPMSHMLSRLKNAEKHKRNFHTDCHGRCILLSLIFYLERHVTVRYFT